MVEGVVAHLMTFGNDLIVEVVVSQHIFANHKEGSLDIMFAKSFQYEGGRLGDRTIIERYVNRTFVRIHSPSRPGIKPAQPFCRLFYKHYSSTFTS